MSEDQLRPLQLGEGDIIRIEHEHVSPGVPCLAHWGTAEVIVTQAPPGAPLMAGGKALIRWRDRQRPTVCGITAADPRVQVTRIGQEPV